MKKSSVLRFLNKPFWYVGIIVAAAISTCLTLYITVWEWIENPGGIFRDENGTRWNFVYDTASSWFEPTFISTFMTAAIVHLALSKIGVIPKLDDAQT